jgi:hypothetical protein
MGMGTRKRTGATIAVTGLAAAGFAFLAVGNAEATVPLSTSAESASEYRTCRYKVNARSGLNVRKKPNGKIVDVLKHGDIIWADCAPSHGGWVRLSNGVPPRLVGKWVFQRFLCSHPRTHKHDRGHKHDGHKHDKGHKHDRGHKHDKGHKHDRGHKHDKGHKHDRGHHPHGAVQAGGGASAMTAGQSDSPATAAGLGALALGGTLLAVSRRRHRSERP